MISKLGKIKTAKFGFGGYQDVQIVFSFEVAGDGWATVYTHECGWGHVSKADLEKPDSNYKWTHESRIQKIGEKAFMVTELMQDAKVRSLDKLIGIPVRAHFESEYGSNTYFEILKEVL